MKKEIGLDFDRYFERAWFSSHPWTIYQWRMQKKIRLRWFLIDPKVKKFHCCSGFCTDEKYAWATAVWHSNIFFLISSNRYNINWLHGHGSLVWHSLLFFVSSKWYDMNWLHGTFCAKCINTHRHTIPILTEHIFILATCKYFNL